MLDTYYLSNMAKRKPQSRTLLASGRRIRSSITFGVVNSRMLKGRGQTKAEKKFQIVAYNGGRMSPSGITSECVIDLQGTSFDNDHTVILENHKTDRDSRIGHATSQLIVTAGQRVEGVTGPTIHLSGRVSSKSRASREFVRDAKEGFPFQASIGGEIKAARFIQRGQSAVVNGQTHQGPFLHVKKFIIREVSVLPLGADSSTSTSLAAKAGSLSEITAMTFAQWLKSLGLTEKSLNAKQTKAMKAQFASLQKLTATATVEPDENDETEEDETEDETPRRTVAQRNSRGMTVANANKRRRFVAGRLSRDEVDDVDPDSDDDDDSDEDHISARRREAIAEDDRMSAIRATAAEFEVENEDEVEIKVGKKTMGLAAFRRYALTSGMSADAFELQLRRASLPTMPRGPAIHIQNKDISNDAMVAALCRANGMVSSDTNKYNGKKYGYEHYFSEEVLEASEGRQYQIGNSIQALMDTQIRAAGMYHESADRSTRDFFGTAHEAYQKIAARSRMVRASGFSSLNIVYVLENVMNKSALAAFTAEEGVWRDFVSISPVKDFRPAVQYALDLSGSYKKVAADGELRHIGMVDTKYSIQADTYGAMITIDRKTLKNDDLNVIFAQAAGIGLLGAQRLEESVFVLLLSNPSSFFSAGNKNYISGGSSALSITSLETARSTFRKQVINGKPVSVSPDRILVGTALEITAKKIYKDAGYTVATGGSGTAYFDSNEFQNKYRPLVSPWLDNTDITDQDGAAITGQSATQWYLFPSPNLPQGAAVKAAFVDGRQVPYFDQADTQFSIPGGIQMRSYMDWGVAMGRTQLGFKSAGA